MTRKVLCYTTAFDLGNSNYFEQLARMFTSSLQKSGFMGDIKIIHTGTNKIFKNYRHNVEEIAIDMPKDKRSCFTIKYEARHFLKAKDYDWVMFFDSDCIVNTALDHWFTGPEIIRYVQEDRMPIQLSQFSSYLTDVEMANLTQPGYNSGTFVIKAEYFREITEIWETIDRSPPLRPKPGWDQSAWNRLLLDTHHIARSLASPSVDFYYDKQNINSLLESPVLHYCGANKKDRLLGMQAKFLSNFYSDHEGSLIGILER